MTVFGIIFFSTILIGLLVLITYNDNFFSGLFASVITTIILGTIFVLLGSINTKYEKSKVFGVTYIKSITLNSKINSEQNNGTYVNKIINNETPLTNGRPTMNLLTYHGSKPKSFTINSGTISSSTTSSEFMNENKNMTPFMNAPATTTNDRVYWKCHNAGAKL